jgi:hypothetical protein
MRDAAAEGEERVAEEERRRVRKGRRDTLCGWIRDRLDLANHPLPSAPCPAVIADCLERVRIFGQPLTGSQGRTRSQNVAGWQTQLEASLERLQGSARAALWHFQTSLSLVSIV